MLDVDGLTSQQDYVIDPQPLDITCYKPPSTTPIGAYVDGLSKGHQIVALHPADTTKPIHPSSGRPSMPHACSVEGCGKIFRGPLQLRQHAKEHSSRPC